MKDLQHDVFLALGSNLGNRYDHLQAAIEALFETVGGIQKISSVYESPAMGFEGPAFLNCVVWLRSRLSASKVLKAVLTIEKRLGRERKTTETYTSRPIDIDVLFYDQEIKETTQLTLPHPELEHRRFVLQPMAEIYPQWHHPVSGKNMIRLLAETNDESALEKQSKWLRNPIKNIDFARFNYVAIEGNIGAGKTSLSTQIAEEFNAKLILERFKDNPFLPKFYKDQSRYAFPLEMSFLADRYQQLVEDIAQFDLFKDCVVTDYDLYKSLIFAQVTLAEEEFTLYKKLFQIMHKELPQPDVYVYLYQHTERLLENIKKRGRSYEQNIQPEYLQQIHEGYFNYIKSLPSEKVKVIDVSDLDFVKNRSDYLTLVRTIVD
ncbi:2-amino-4-hydroxy-6-hydroxymethyldihydropteridine diphosphokinase [Altibacter sp. HG106]|uniref:2-amino-4-hydroxy-6- hydroxymethyldihydropteridine diphosphokinase n=1 Tax=Altibacter sp. HG106 TaxID=3023937 RepID=UPI002350FBC2|nr:2-amino-4-hydroxy-6-hydroxymethyldihydropteridine diphosphokinase [Altibacter sp. HG106]MDC7994605.1 2-amino-4-hydroxy-6-hydroxymethyldihydropteridine diphosphokinase [Altibacter sp. HG106]